MYKTDLQRNNASNHLRAYVLARALVILNYRVLLNRSLTQHKPAEHSKVRLGQVRVDPARYNRRAQEREP